MATMQNFASVYETVAGAVSNVANGRVDLFHPIMLQIPQYQLKPEDNKRFASEALVGQLQKNELSDLFFSAMNIDALQSGLRYGVFKQTGEVIGRQSDTELKIVMRSIYFQYARHQNSDVVAQVRVLNGHVLEWVVKEISSNVKQQYKYQKDASTMPVPLEFGQNTSVKGERQLEPMKKAPM